MADPYGAVSGRNIRGPARYLWYLVASQPGRIAAGAILSSLWMVGLAVPSYLLSRAIDDGLRPKHTGTLLAWAALMLTVGAVNAIIGMFRHRVMTMVRMDAAFRTVRAVVGHATRLGATLRRRVTAGEVVTIGIGDVWTIAMVLTVTGPGFGGVVAYIVVAVLLFGISPLLAIVVLAGVPVLGLVVGPLLQRLQKTGTAYRDQQGALTARIVDIIGGLRILNGLGGKDVYAGRYRSGSAALRTEGYRVGAVTSWIDSLGIGLPALFLAVVTWLSARMAAQGTISVGDVVAVYGYVAALVVPVAFFIEGSSDVARALVSARRVTTFLTISPEAADVLAPVDPPSPPAVLHDPASGVSVAPGLMTALACARQSEAEAVVDRLGRFADTDATWGGIRLDDIAVARVRDRILVADNEADLFSGSLREMVSGREHRDEEPVRLAVRAAMASDIVDGLPDGLGSPIDAQGRNLSGGQRQRIRLIRALLAEPDILLAVEPTSAVDAHTEAGMAAGLREARTGRATLVTTTSPLLLDRADVVYYLVDGYAVASGTHHELLASQSGYRALVSRGTEDVPLNLSVREAAR